MTSIFARLLDRVLKSVMMTMMVVVVAVFCCVALPNNADAGDVSDKSVVITGNADVAYGGRAGDGYYDSPKIFTLSDACLRSIRYVP